MNIVSIYRVSLQKKNMSNSHKDLVTPFNHPTKYNTFAILKFLIRGSRMSCKISKVLERGCQSL